jgi:TRAP-type mannitol/chloroaromatic compound transport system permease small subunit
VRTLLKISDGIYRLLERIAFAGGWLMIVLMAVTCFDVVARKFGLPVQLTRFQEFEWHLHAAIFSCWLGYCYTINAHPRVDSYTEALEFRTRAWIEFCGCLVFALPYTAFIAWYSIDFVYQSYAMGEQSESAVGLGHRWIIKTVYAIGLWLIVLAIVSVLLRLIAFLFGKVPQSEAALQIGHVAADV